MRNNLSRMIIGVIAVCMMIFAVSPVLACSPSEDYFSLTFEDRVEHAPMIVVGTVSKGYASSYGNGYEFVREVDVVVEQYYRGEGPAIVRIDGFGQGPDCLSAAPPVGSRAIFFVEGDPHEGLNAVYLSAHDAVYQAESDRLDVLSNMVGNGVAPYPLPIQDQIVRMASQYAIPIGVVGAILIVLIALFMVFKYRSDPRKSKAKRS